MIIRPYNKTDLDSVIQLWEACSLTRPWNNPSLDIQRKVAVADNLFLLAEMNELVVGSVMGGYDGHRGWINYLAVSPEQQKQGIARELMHTIEAKLLALGCPKINLQIRDDNNEAIGFYNAIGFTQDPVLSFGKRLLPDE